MASVYLKQVNFYLKNYGNSGAPDQRCVETFIECETGESIRMLQNELRSITTGNFDEHSMDVNVGPARKARHGSYEAWAKLMLLWIASYIKAA
jgi:hypothetical protein